MQFLRGVGNLATLIASSVKAMEERDTIERAAAEYNVPASKLIRCGRDRAAGASSDQVPFKRMLIC